MAADKDKLVADQAKYNDLKAQNNFADDEDVAAAQAAVDEAQAALDSANEALTNAKNTLADTEKKNADFKDALANTQAIKDYEAASTTLAEYQKELAIFAF